MSPHCNVFSALNISVKYNSHGHKSFTMSNALISLKHVSDFKHTEQMIYRDPPPGSLQ